MNVATFLKHWGVREHPFAAEEARQDVVLSKLHGESPHPDFHKVLGDPRHPASAVVFGEKGSGKTAIRLLLEQRIGEDNELQANEKDRTLVVAYDEWNPVLDRLARRVKGKTPLESLQQMRLVDHIDGLLSVAVSDLVDAALGGRGEGHVEFDVDVAKHVKKLDAGTRGDWLILQALYDRPDQAVRRGRQLRSAMRERTITRLDILKLVRVLMWILLAGASAIYAWKYFAGTVDLTLQIGFGAIALLTILITGKVWWDTLGLRRLARKISGQLRVLDRGAESYAHSLEMLRKEWLDTTQWPIDDLDDPRYAMLDRLVSAVSALGYSRIVVLIDRVDEPTLVSGGVERMKAVVWPLMNNKFLQQRDIVFKMMLPIEVRHELHRQSSDFFQSARLDKQNMIDRLSWSGAMLYDLCTTRLHACLEEGAERVALIDLFDESTMRQDVVDALDQMRQPRDAFKLMYQVIQEHCSNTTQDEANWRIPKLVLDQVRRSQSDRLEGLQRGLRPA